METLLDNKVQWVANYINARYNHKHFIQMNTKSRTFKVACEELFFLNKVLQIGVDLLCGSYTGSNYDELMCNYCLELKDQLLDKTINTDYYRSVVIGRNAIIVMISEYRKKWRKYGQI